MNERKRRGDRGEAAVADALVRRGYAVLERQFRCRWGEIDLIVCAPDGILCFVEVKSRSSRGIAAAREAVTSAKQQRIRDAAGAYLAQAGLDCPCRFDVAEVYPDAAGKWESPKINYFINAFQ